MGAAVRRIRASSLLMLALVTAAACSPDTLPDTPSLVTVGGGGARYNGTITTRRLPGGNFTIVEGVQSLSLSLTVRGTDQINGRLEAGSTGSLTGTLTGNLASGSFQATLLISTPAQQGRNCNHLRRTR